MCRKLIYLVSFVLGLAIAVTSTANADSSLVGWWKFDEGSKISTLQNGKQNAGNHKNFWNGRDASGNRVATGVYLYRVVTSEKRIAHKMILIK